MYNLVNTLVATLAISLFSLGGIFALSLKEKTLHNLLFVLIAFSAGTILGAAYFDLLPEAIEIVDDSSVFIWVTLGYVGFYILERFIYWYHGHGHESDISTEINDKKSTKDFAYLNLIGDGIHNFIDGIIIATSFLIGFSVGLATTLAVIFHEFPQEIGDYGILVYAGFKRKKALLLNFIVSFAVVFGGIFANFFIENIETLSGLLIAISAGGFIYLSASELIPELNKENNFKKSAIQFIIFILGITLIWSLGIIFPE
jgi:zinc and cadmium transporter